MATEHHTSIARAPEGPVARRLQVAAALAILGVATAGHGIAAGAFDGVYHGTQKETLNNNSGDCNNLNRDVTIKIVNGHFSRNWRVDLPVDVAADGSFYVSVVASQRPLRTAELKGKIVGGRLEADIGTSLCAAHLSLTKS